MRKSVLLAFLIVFVICLNQTPTWSEGLPFSGASDTVVTPSGKDTVEEEEIDVEFKTVFTSDPIQPYNRAIFTFNDTLYHYGLKPLCKGYNAVVPEPARRSVANFFRNLKMPKRFFNCLFQGKIKGAGTEALRFVINSTVGIGGLFDPATKVFNLEIQDEDFGQTLGHYHSGQGAYIVWPFLGPSNVRDTFGFIGDMFLDPLFWVSVAVDPYVGTGLRAYRTVNDVSIDKGKVYEDLTEAAIDPYIAIQDAYIHNRIMKIRE